MKGKLYLVATPIGNLDDITLRALRTLKEVDLIACEDTRHTRKLLNHFDIQKPLISYHEHNERTRSDRLIEELLAGKNVAVVSDAGTPGISDPGYNVISAAIDAGIHIIPIPGASALISALIAAGLSTNEFHFVGFLPAKSSARRSKLKEMSAITSTVVFYEAPHRLKTMLEDLLEIFGDRKAAVARELTKMHEEFRRGSLSEIVRNLDEPSVRGEFVIVVEGAILTATEEHRTIVEQVQSLIEQSGLTKMEAIKQVARLRGLSKNEVYMQVVERRDS